MKNHMKICDVAYKTQYGVNPLRIIFDKVDRYTIIYDGTKYLTLFHSDEKYESVLMELNILSCQKALFQTFIFINMQTSKLIQMMIYF